MIRILSCLPRRFGILGVDINHGISCDFKAWQFSIMVKASSSSDHCGVSMQCMLVRWIRRHTSNRGISKNHKAFGLRELGLKMGEG